MTQSLPDMSLRGPRERRARQPEQSAKRTRRRSTVALAGVPCSPGSPSGTSSGSPRHRRVSFAPGDSDRGGGRSRGDPVRRARGPGEGGPGGGGRSAGLPGDFFGELSASTAGRGPRASWRRPRCACCGCSGGRVALLARSRSSRSSCWRASRGGSARSTARPELVRFVARHVAVSCRRGRPRRAGHRSPRGSPASSARSPAAAFAPHVVGVPAAGDRARDPRLVARSRPTRAE